MLQAMQGVHGVPQLIEYWLVETKAHEVDETMNYCGKIWKSIKGTSCMHVCLVLKPHTQPLHMFQMKVELVSAIQDIIRSKYSFFSLFFPLTHFLVQQIAVEEHGILHHNCSLNYTMIEDDGDGSHGMLIDWEFAIHILVEQNMLSEGWSVQSYLCILNMLTLIVRVHYLSCPACFCSSSLKLLAVWQCLKIAGNTPCTPTQQCPL
jgi:hypothetical protein